MAKDINNLQVNTIHDREPEKNAVHLKGRHVDTGCGIKPYKALLAPYVTDHIHRGPLKWLPIIPVIGLVIQGISYIFDRLDKSEQWTWAYMIVARKH